MQKYRIKIDNQVYEVEVEKVEDNSEAQSPNPAPTVSQTPVTGESLNSPIQGTILKVLVKENEKVKAGQPLVILEAMKLENEIVSNRSGTIESIHVKEQDVVDNGQPLVTYRSDVNA